MKRSLGNLFLAILLAGCATTHPIKPEKLSSISRLGAISLLGNELCVTFSGTTRFTSKRLSSDVTNWRIDDFVEEAIRKTIESEGRYSYISMDIDRDRMMHVYGPRKNITGVFPEYSARDYDLNRVKEEIKHIRSRYDIDTLVFVLESDDQAATKTCSRYLVGYGLHRETCLGLNQTNTYAYARIAVVDTGDLQELSSISVPGGETIDNRYWKSGFEGLAPEEKEFIEHSIKCQLWEHIAWGLKKMALIKE